MKLLVIISISVILLFTGCATSYQPKSYTGGYSETRLSKNIFEVHFNGNASTSKERANDITLLRASELVLENGFNYFVILNREYDEDVSVYKTAPTATTTYNSTTNLNGNSTFNAYVYGNNVKGYSNTNYYGTTNGTTTTTINPGQTYVYKKPISTIKIICMKDKPTNNVSFYEAKFINESIKQKYQIK